MWRFFQKHGDVFTLQRLPGALGCLIFNKLYPSDIEVSIPEYEKIERIIAEIRILAKNEQKVGSDQENLGRLIALYSRILLTDCAESAENTSAQNRVALFDPYILHAYFSTRIVRSVYMTASVGEIIDRMALKMHAKDGEHAAQLILYSMITYTRNLSPDEFNKAIWIVLSVIKESLSVNEPEAILKVIRQIESILPFEA